MNTTEKHTDIHTAEVELLEGVAKTLANIKECVSKGHRFDITICSRCGATAKTNADDEQEAVYLSGVQ